MPAHAKLGPAVVFLASALALSACAHKAPKELPPEPGPATSTDTGQMGGTVVPGSQADFVQIMAGADTIYFDTDKYNIDSTDQVALAKQAQWLQRYPAKRATIEGHADERGTREYNLALGARRAAATRDFLTSKGVAGNRMKTISYGKERPVAVCDDISCWSQNRRAVTVLNGAGS